MTQTVSVCGFTCLRLQLHVRPPRLTELLFRHCTKTGSSAVGHTETNMFSITDTKCLHVIICCLLIESFPDLF